MKKFCLPLTLVVTLLAFSFANAQDFSNKGTDFWLCFPSHTPSGTSLAQQYVYITSDQNSSGSVSYNGTTQTFTVTANTVTTVPITRSAAYINPSDPMPINKGIHVLVDNGQPPVVVYTEIYASARTEASLILPVNVLGRSYRAASYYQISTSGSQSQFQVIAVETNTTVQIQLMQNGALSGAPFQITLPNIGDVYQIQEPQDISGTLIESVATATEPCKRIAVFSGSSSLAINGTSCSGGSYDPLLQQCYPINSWGKNFGVIPISGNPNGYEARAMASQDNTTVNYNGVNVVLNAGEVYPAIAANVTPQTQPIFISADKPISVSQYLLSQNCAGPNGTIGDPDMVILNPIEQNIKDITIFTSTHQSISSQLLNVLIPTAGANSFKINGTIIPGFLPMPANPAFSYLQYQFPLGDNSYTLSADSGFNAICWGLGSVETYGYSAGTNVLDLYQFIQISNPFATVNFPAACQGTPFYFSIVFPYQPTQIAWNFDNNLNAMGINDTTVNPVPYLLDPINGFDSTWNVNGKQLYRYKLQLPYVINTPGGYQIQVTAQNPNPDGCSGTQVINYPLQVYPVPDADFNFTSNGCVNSPVNFTGITNNTGGRPVTVFTWTFGDAATASIQNPVHTYTVTGSYNAKFSFITDVGCVSDTATKIVTVTGIPAALFATAPPYCVNEQITFGNQSTAAPGSALHKFYWNFGDASAQLVDTTGNPQTHIYTAPGPYLVTLVAETTTGCTSPVFSQQVIIHPKPFADFTFTGICLPATTQFNSTTTISDGTQAQFIYAWNFGDGNIGGNQPAPTHTYTAGGPYQVDLTVTSNNGCVDDTIKTVSNIYAQPVASFTAPAEVCNGDAVTFTDQSTAANNTVTGWNWNFGDGNSSTQQSPSHVYAATGSYGVTLTVTSQAGCVSAVATKNVVVNSLPTANFNFSAPNCENKTVSFTDISLPNAGSLTNWNWDFGDGNTSTSQNPANTYTTAGTYTVKLQVKTSKGCMSTVFSRQITIHTNPIANFGIPESCLLDPFSQFSDSSSISAGSINQWNWNFGDANATPPNNTSAQQNPQHKYTVVGPYNVTLIVTSNNGCSDTISKAFFVNGAIPVPQFNIQGPTTFCSGGTINITDNSTVNPGNVVKLDIYWDYTSDPTIKTTDDTPSVGKSYTHFYPEFSSPATRTVTIRYVAYSGQTCLQYVDRTITLYATPAIQFNPIPGVCMNVPAFQVTQASLTNGLPGAGVFSGPGISATGMFDPAVAGVGVHTIRYTYVSTNGCVNYKEQPLEVYPVPVANAGPDKFVLQGGFVELTPAMNAGFPVSYSWLPAAYLDNANIENPKASPPDDITYTLTVISEHGCQTSDAVFVKVLKAPEIPNIFSPNGDGVHDTWTVKYLASYPGCTVEIYNRYGQLIFHSVGYDKEWDGKINGKPAPVGTYYYIIDPKNGRQKIAGYVDVIR